MTETPRYLTTAQMAEETGFPIESIRTALRNGEMPFVRLGKGRNRGYFVRREAFEQWLKDCEQGTKRQEPSNE